MEKEEVIILKKYLLKYGLQELIKNIFDLTEEIEDEV
jgi:hypothetical protein